MVQIPMFKKNTGHLQGSIFGTVETLLSESQKKAFLGSPQKRSFGARERVSSSCLLHIGLEWTHY